MVAQGVYRAGFTGIAAADKGNFGRRVGQILQVVDGGEKFCVLKKVHV
jgi:hypothetical protein